MTRVGQARIAVLLFGGVLSIAAVGCGGGSKFKDKPRPPVPLQLSGVITENDVSVEPDHLGAGPVTLIISNQSNRSHTVTIEGGPRNTTEQVGPINPLDTGRIQETLQEGTYEVRVGSSQATADEIQPATLDVGPPRPSSSGKVLLP